MCCNHSTAGDVFATPMEEERRRENAQFRCLQRKINWNSLILSKWNIGFNGFTAQHSTREHTQRGRVWNSERIHKLMQLIVTYFFGEIFVRLCISRLHCLDVGCWANRLHGSLLWIIIPKCKLMRTYNYAWDTLHSLVANTKAKTESRKISI